MLAFTQQPGVKEVVQVTQPALSTLAQTILGSIAVVCLAVAGIAVWQLIRVQNARAADQKAFREEYKALVDQNTKLFDKMTTAVSGLREAVAALTEQEKGAQGALAQFKSTLDNVQNTMQLLLLQSGRRSGPSSSPPKMRG